MNSEKRAEWELYDLQEDPHELQNVYNDPAYADIREEMHQRPEHARERYGDSDELTELFLPENEEALMEGIRRYRSTNWTGYELQYED